MLILQKICIGMEATAMYLDICGFYCDLIVANIHLLDHRTHRP